MEPKTRIGISASVDVLPSWLEHGVLQIELKTNNIDLLLEDPPAVPASWFPSMSHPNVHWIPVRNHVRCKWWDSRRKKWRIESDHVKLEPHMSVEEKQSMVFKAAAALEQFFKVRHNVENNMPLRRSAESAHVGGRNTRRKLVESG